ncbi:YgjV family protein [Shewanella eurypsychrophilus]|uniref:YgjV family protein n=1 Tax=Shewanella eurypsychrophilus TaxID=2593656 RepID=A0ABX6V2N9_9GAMM|nr:MULTISPECIES: YgjV family protein [Shewanella]QFU21584.1 hypothetical protein FS418_06665 [Shewanella sp. YLB-09]QPG56874.1 YgjV family protein [Shewanella eurypsychrophilus]
MDFNWVEWFGYLASLIVLVSLTMTSIKKLRLINLVGCLAFAGFAYLINSYPTMFMNLGIAGINVYYLWKFYSTDEQFKLIAASVNTEYFDHFISENLADIETQTSLCELGKANTAFYMLRDNSIAGVLVGNNNDKGELSILLDYVTPQYRDFKLANYYFVSHPDEIKQRGVNTLIAKAATVEHKEYLFNIGFELADDAEGIYQKQL